MRIAICLSITLLWVFINSKTDYMAYNRMMIYYIDSKGCLPLTPYIANQNPLTDCIAQC